MKIYELIVYCLLGLALIVFAPKLSEINATLWKETTKKTVPKNMHTLLYVFGGVLIIVFNILVYLNIIVYR